MIESAGDEFFQRLQQQDDLLQLRHRDEYLLCQMLFFGNLNQSMTDFVLNDLGLNQFENYPIDPEHRPYRSNIEIRQHWLLYQLQALFELCDSADLQTAARTGRMIPDDIDQQAPGFRKSERLRYECARQLERQGDLNQPADITGNACCRRVVNVVRASTISAANSARHSSCVTGSSNNRSTNRNCSLPVSSRLRLCKRHELTPLESVAQLHISHRPQIVDLELDYHASVELAVAEFYNATDTSGHCHYVENSLFNGVLGLLIWDVIFAPLPGAFYNPFQYRPSDFYAHDFCARRSSAAATDLCGIDQQ